MKTHIIGVGGVGSWLAYSMAKLIGPDNLVLHDGDKLEASNLDRQLFGSEDVGKFKAEALSRKLGADFINTYFTQNQAAYEPDDVLICCADNNPARVAVLDEADRCGCRAIIAANEVTSAEAYYYDGGATAYFEPGGDVDPRVYYPELTKDKSGDPRAAAIGCTGAAQLLTKQLVSANFMAASLAQWLYVLWVIEIEKFGPDFDALDAASLPYRFRANLSRLEVHLIRDALKIAERTTHE
jgi:molybdopterin/thiamine biosynthesis adenylyltransferase